MTEPYNNLPEPVQREIGRDDVEQIVMDHSVLVTLKDGTIVEFHYQTGLGWRRLAEAIHPI